MSCYKASEAQEEQEPSKATKRAVPAKTPPSKKKKSTLKRGVLFIMALFLSGKKEAFTYQ